MGKKDKLDQVLEHIESVRSSTTSFSDRKDSLQALLRILNAERVPVKHLKIATLEKSLVTSQTTFDPKLGIAVYKEPTVDPDKDPNHFLVRLEDPTLKGRKQIHLNLSIQNPDPEYNESGKIILNEKELGVFESDSLLLIQDKIDDAVPIDNISDNNCNQTLTQCDRTFKSMLGGKIQVEYPEKNISVTAQVPPLKELDVSIYVLKKEGKEVTNPKEIERQVKEANEVFAAAGIKINAKIIPQDIPQGVDLSDGFSEQDEKALFAKLGTVSKDDIQIFYVGDFDKINHPAGREAQAYAHPEKWFTRNEANTIVMSSTQNSYVLAHELGHLLTNEGHFPRDLSLAEEKSCLLKEEDKRNVMMGCGTVINTNKILDSKRWTEEQIEKMQQFRLLKEVKPEKPNHQQEEEEDKKESRSLKRSL